MTRTISQAERRAVKNENAAREAIESADTAMARAEREIMVEADKPGADKSINGLLLKTYAEVRHLLDAARGALG